MPPEFSIALCSGICYNGKNAKQAVISVKKQHVISLRAQARLQALPHRNRLQPHVRQSPHYTLSARNKVSAVSISVCG